MIQLKADFPSSLPPTMDQAIAASWNPVCHITYNRDSWVALHHYPSQYGFDEALLLCQTSQTGWLAWVPDYGEILLDRSDFYLG